jgi:hypothetical protein
MGRGSTRILADSFQATQFPNSPTQPAGDKGLVELGSSLVPRILRVLATNFTNSTKSDFVEFVAKSFGCDSAAL